METRELEILRRIQAVQHDPAIGYAIELMTEYRDRTLEKLGDCSPDEVGRLQGEFKCYKRMIARLSNPLNQA